MKNWAQNKKNPANSVHIKANSSGEYGDIATAFGYIAAVSAIKQRAIAEKKKDVKKC